MFHWLWCKVAEWVLPQGTYIVGYSDEWEEPTSPASR